MMVTNQGIPSHASSIMKGALSPSVVVKTRIVEEVILTTDSSR